MLRTCSRGGVHGLPVLSPPADPTDSIRRQIVDMVRISEHKGQTIVYDLQQHRKVQHLKELDPNRLENIGKAREWQPDIRKLPNRSRQSRYHLDTQRNPGQFGKENHDSTGNVQPPVPRRNFVSFASAAKLSKDKPNMKEGFQPPQPRPPTPPVQTHQDSFKRVRSGLATQKQGPKTKNIRQKTDDSNSHFHSTSSSSPSDDKVVNKVPGQLKPCEIRGSAIPTQRAYVRATSPVKRDEVKKRANRFSASLDFFRRRLKMNQSKFVNSQNKVTPDDYIIRKDDGKHSPYKQRTDLRHVPHPPTTPKQSLIKSSSGTDSHGTKGSRFSYKLPEVEDDEVKQMTLGELRTLPQVQTYVLEDDQEPIVVANKEPAPLTSHNLDIHHMLMDARVKKYKVEQNGIMYDTRLIRWVVDSNTQKVQKMVTFDMSLPAKDRVDTSSSSNGLSFSKTPRLHKWNDVL